MLKITLFWDVILSLVMQFPTLLKPPTAFIYRVMDFLMLKRKP
jgi:hypothetical protein